MPHCGYYLTADLLRVTPSLQADSGLMHVTRPRRILLILKVQPDFRRATRGRSKMDAARQPAPLHKVDQTLANTPGPRTNPYGSVSNGAHWAYFGEVKIDI
jgi:hypothetical protein